ncbi:hypothetical protein [Gimesia panareensis]|uniref:hypothetical protein n=1 Tax=Gimesia panareensis TaxID=2527978 RepID=UPI00118A9BFF|nr:hypothetical protein [Gimesia panareensis]QDU52067.1 hypothetical protein Pan110_44370 [Gimesia panareensis]
MKSRVVTGPPPETAGKVSLEKEWDARHAPELQFCLSAQRSAMLGLSQSPDKIDTAKSAHKPANLKESTFTVTGLTA